GYHPEEPEETLPRHVAVDHGVGIHKAQRHRRRRGQHGDLQRVQQRFDPGLFTEKLDVPCQPWDQDNAELRINDEEPQQANHYYEGQHQGWFTQRFTHEIPYRRCPPPPNWVLRTAISPASLAGQLAVRSTGAQHMDKAIFQNEFAMVEAERDESVNGVRLLIRDLATRHHIY